MTEQSNSKAFIGLIFLAYALGLLVLTYWLASYAPKRPEHISHIPSQAAPAPKHLHQSPPDFASIKDTQEKKTAFYNYMLPGIEHHNHRLAESRQFLLAVKAKLEAGKTLTTKEQKHQSPS